MRSDVALALVCLTGCVYGGSHEDPLMGYKPGQIASDAGAAATDGALSADAASPSHPAKDAAQAVAVDAALAGGDASVDLPSDAGSDAGSDAAQSCMPATSPATCDPVRNTGCPPFTQCDIDPTAAVLTGRCALSGSGSSGATCSASSVSESCPAQSTCVGNACHKMCYCDADCGAGACCNDTSAPGLAGAIRLCKPC